MTESRTYLALGQPVKCDQTIVAVRLLKVTPSCVIVYSVRFGSHVHERVSERLAISGHPYIRSARY